MEIITCELDSTSNNTTASSSQSGPRSPVINTYSGDDTDGLVHSTIPQDLHALFHKVVLAYLDLILTTKTPPCGLGDNDRNSQYLIENWTVEHLANVLLEYRAYALCDESPLRYKVHMDIANKSIKLWWAAINMDLGEDEEDIDVRMKYKHQAEERKSLALLEVRKALAVFNSWHFKTALVQGKVDNPSGA